MRVENNETTTRASIIAQRMTDASEDDEDSDHSNENDNEQAPPPLTQQSPIHLGNAEYDRLTEKQLPDSEATDVVPAETKLTFVGKNLSLDDEDNESDSDDDSEVWRLRKRHARKILAPLSSRQFFKPNLDNEAITKKRLQRPKSASELRLAEQHANLHRRRQSAPLLVSAEARRLSSPGRTRKSKVPSRLRVLTSPSRTNPMHGQRPNIPLPANVSRKDGTKSRLAPLATRNPLVGRKRRPFSREESLAVKNGVLKFGGDWALIKAHFKDILASRSLINIKDHARILIIKGRLDPASLKFYGEEDVVLVDV